MDLHDSQSEFFLWRLHRAVWTPAQAMALRTTASSGSATSVSGGAEEGIGAGFGGLADDRAVDDAVGGSAIVLSPALQCLAVE